MQKIIFIDETGAPHNGYIDQTGDSSNSTDLIKDDRKNNLKEHLYITYLVFGTLAFAFGIYISVRRLKATK